MRKTVGEMIKGGDPQVPVDDPLWEKAPRVLARGHHIEGAILILHEPAWFGVSTMMGRNYAVRAISWPVARQKLIEHDPSVAGDHGYSWAIHPDSYTRDGVEIAVHENLDERYPSRDVVRMRPLSLDEIPADNEE